MNPECEANLSDNDPEHERRFVEFFRRHSEKAHRIAWRLVGGDSAAASDVVQDTFLKAYTALDTYQERDRMEAWFYRILVRQASNYRRWRNLRTLWSSSSDIDQADPAPDSIGDPLLAGRLRAALDRLTTNQRSAFILIHLEGFTANEAADLMGSAAGTVKSHLQRALVKLRKELRDLEAIGVEGHD